MLRGFAVRVYVLYSGNHGTKQWMEVMLGYGLQEGEGAEKQLITSSLVYYFILHSMTTCPQFKSSNGK